MGGSWIHSMLQAAHSPSTYSIISSVYWDTLPVRQKQFIWFFLGLFLYCKIKHVGCKIFGKSKSTQEKITIAHNPPSQTFRDNHNILMYFF